MTKLEKILQEYYRPEVGKKYEEWLASIRSAVIQELLEEFPKKDMITTRSAFKDWLKSKVKG